MTDDAVEEGIKLSSEELKRNLTHYRTTLAFMGANVPIEVLCLPKRIEATLVREGYVRVYDLIRQDFGKIKGIGKIGIEVLTARLDEFFTVSI